MEKSKVYFTNLRTTSEMTILQKLDKLIRKAGIDTIDFKDKFVAIKIHLGEPGNLAYLRPNYSKVIVDYVKNAGARVFLTDSNTLYVGRRKNGLDHLDAAYENGYNPFTTGCHVVIADGIKGTDDVEVPVQGGEYVQTAKIGRAIMDADIFISMSHFKGHEATGFGGALKNIGMGSGSRAGKMEMHSSGKPKVRASKCRMCARCAKVCAHEAVSFDEKGVASIDHNRCVGCGRCVGMCAFDAVQPSWDEANDVLNCKIAEYSKAVLQDRPSFHVSFLIDVSPYCDCHAENDLPVIPDVGMFASFDPVAMDIACADMANRQPVISGSMLDEAGHHHAHDHFAALHPETNWMSSIDHAEKLRIGSREYELIEV